MSRESRDTFFTENKVYASLNPGHRDFIQEAANTYHLSFQNIKRLTDIASDLEMWEEGSLRDIWTVPSDTKSKGKELAKLIMNSVVEKWEELRDKCKDYSEFTPLLPDIPPAKFVLEEEENTLLGRCPVASEKTRCCNLQTLDAVKNCGFACSYCSIQSFYTEGKIVFQKDFAEKLQKLEIDRNRVYHIGTGQSSDSLMWGNKYGLLDALFEFADKYPNVILELKTKSDNISYLKDHRIPENVIITWSLNTDTVIKAEEHLTASLDRRLAAARTAADRGALVGFHFHPMVYYENWEKEYGEIFSAIQDNFSPDETALISIGTLTFIKPVIKVLRKQKIRSKILQMPMEDASGKLSYPVDIKRLMFKTLYDSFSAEWKEKVFFYMCMEEKSLWPDVFGYRYNTNEEFESAMKESYMNKIDALRRKRGII